jgi:lipopolysaccharide transport system permease protein
LWDFRELLLVLVMRDISVRYKQTVLGVAWAVIQPVFTMVVFSIVFGRLAKLPSDGVPYRVRVRRPHAMALLLQLGDQCRLKFAEPAGAADQDLPAALFRPRICDRQCARGPAISFLVYLALMLAYGVPLGGGCRVARSRRACSRRCTRRRSHSRALTVTYRDLRHIVPFLTLVWLYVTPVIYP